MRKVSIITFCYHVMPSHQSVRIHAFNWSRYATEIKDLAEETILRKYSNKRALIPTATNRHLVSYTCNIFNHHPCGVKLVQKNMILSQFGKSSEELAGS